MVREFTEYVIKQDVKLADDTNEWVKLETFTKETLAWEHYDRLKGKGKIVLIKVQKFLLARTED